MNEIETAAIEQMEAMVILVNKNILKFEDIVIPLQTWIQQHGGLPEDNPHVKEFLIKTRGA